MLLAAFFTGCATPRLPPVDLSQPHWSIYQGQAVWSLPQGEASIAGDLLLAIGSNGQAWVQFAKTPLPVATVQQAPGRWQLELNLPEARTFHGRGRPPARVIWFQLPALAQAAPGDIRPPWQATISPSPLSPEPESNPEVEFELRHPRTGEFLQGFLSLIPLP